jgi:hypothetical protein
MAHAHAGNPGDFLKHTVLADVLIGAADRFPSVRYIDPYCGQGIYYRPKTFWRPSGHPRLERFLSVQPGLPDWYFGSPLIAARCLIGRSASMHVSDHDGDALVSAAAALSSEEFWRQILPDVQRPVVQGLRLDVRDYDPNSLDPIAPPGVNVLLLDPTYSKGYRDILRRSVAACRASSALFLLLAWGLESWHLGAALADLDIRPNGVRFSEAGRCYELLLCPIGESHDMIDVAAGAVAGWE